MRIVNKVVAAVLAVSLLGQNMLFAQQTLRDPVPPSLIQMQTQAREDVRLLQERSKLYNYIAGGASIGFVFTLGALLLEKLRADENAAKAAKLVEENLKLKQDKADLSKHLDRANKQNKALTDEINETRQLYFQESQARTQTENFYRQHARRASEAKQQTKLQSADMEAFYKKEIARLEEELQHSNLFITKMSYFGPKQALIDMDKYTKIYDANISATERANLVKKITQEPWFKNMPKAEQAEFMRAITRLEGGALQGINKTTLLYSTYPIIQGFMEKHMTSGTQHLLALYRGFLTKGNLVMVALLTFGAVSSYASNKQIQNNEIANRLDNNFDLFIKATPEELKAMEGNDTIYSVCLKNSAILHELTTYTPKQLQTVETELQQIKARQQIRKASLPAKPVAR